MPHTAGGRGKHRAFCQPTGSAHRQGARSPARVHASHQPGFILGVIPYLQVRVQGWEPLLAFFTALWSLVGLQ